MNLNNMMGILNGGLTTMRKKYVDIHKINKFAKCLMYYI